MAISTVRVPGEEKLIESVRVDDAWALVEEFSHLVRESGTDQEREAVRRITSRLDAWGVSYTVHEPELWISLPGRASLTVGERTYAAKTPSMAASTGPGGRTAPVVYLASGYARSVNEIFTAGGVEGDVAGKFVVTEGMPMPGKVAELESRGAAGVVCIAPGERIHEGICTSIWGSPDLTSWDRQPRIPVVSVSNPDGKDLIERIARGATATMVAEHETRWRTIPVVEARIEGTVEPERFVLVHGHLDSWHVGIGDNATGDATLLELARVLRGARDGLARSVRICWWSGHSHGRYAGSTWYADTFANDIARNCVCHINCDSPGCRDATVYSDVYWMAEVEGFARQAIQDIAGTGSEGRSPIRAGDISFNNLGVSTFFMLSSTMPEALRQERGLYAVGGCGGNVEWHTEADTMEIADRDNLLRDIRLYAGATFRAANAPVHPLDFRATLDQVEAVLKERGEQVGDLVDLASAFSRVAEARQALASLYQAADRAESVRAARPVNDALLRVGRALVSLLYSREGRYRQDPALEVPALPDFSEAVKARGTVPDGVVRTELLRARNRLEGALLEVGDAAAAVTA
jgi:N-acetylated-alpha-linked acidic dipeptidase